MKIGFDVGSCYLKAVLVDPEGRILDHQFQAHNGQPREAVERFRAKHGDQALAVGFTGALSSLFRPAPEQRIDEVEAMIKGCRALEGPVRNILYLGASSISLLKIDEAGQLLDFRTNSVCAAGTGAFLDQQAERMKIDISECARFRDVENVPSVAARCAVFAKSDLIHRQQEGYTIPELWCGLCRGLSFTIANTLLLGETLRGKTALIGGVALNEEVVRWLREIIQGDLHVVERPHLAAAVGTALLAPEQAQTLHAVPTARLEALKRQEDGPGRHRPPLELRRSHFPSEEVYQQYVDDADNEVRILEPLRGAYRASLGMDIGSTSTKIAILDEDDRVLVDIYRRTAGDPIGAMKKLLMAVDRILRESGAELEITACGTTGSGRKLVGEIMGADRAVNEITAHARGAVLLFGEEIETIFEIGGQDSKYVHMIQGRVDQVNMNYVCAAGTGSFVEEQAARLGYGVREIGDVVLGIAPPFTSERCTVFMERDVEKLLQEGYTRQEAMAAVLYSVCFNYLTKVVGNRPVTGEKILFQGATAKNKGLVAAFEIILEREIVTSHFCHVTGAIGAAWLARRKVLAEGGETTFRGLDLYTRKVDVFYEQCDLCTNHCKITFAKIEGSDATPSWGYMCGRDPDDTRKKTNVHFAPFERRRALFMKTGSRERKTDRGGPGVVMPRALSTYAHLPLWRTFFAELGIPFRVTPQTDRRITEMGISASTADFCFPVKIFLGHVSDAIRSEDRVFIPHVIGGEKTRFTTKSVFCPYVQAAPSIARSSEALGEALRGRLLNPVIDFSVSDGLNVRELHRVLEPYGLGRRRIRKAWRAGLEALTAFQRACLEEGQRILEEVERSGEKAIVVTGRYYNIYDGGINLEIPRKISELGFRVIPYEMLPFHEKDVGSFFQNMFWYYGQRILNAARFVRERKNLFLLYLTNFSCGPDSFILSYVEEIMGKKPSLILEIDEHSADTGYGTRLEAFADLVAEYGEPPEEKTALYVKAEAEDLHRKKILFVPMHEAVVPLFAAAFEKHGYETLVLPEITPEQFEIGRKHTRGSECLPAHVTTGNLLYTLERQGIDPGEAALFMPTSDGPCRFGQYATLDRILLNKLGYEDLTIISPSAQNTYMGLEGALRKDLWKGILVGDILFKLYCRTAPYEEVPGEARKTFESALEEAVRSFREGMRITRIIENAAVRFSAVRRTEVSKPLVGIVGEIFVRCNFFSCDRVVDWILEAGGEPWLAPISEWPLFTAYIHRYEARKRRQPGELLDAYLNNGFLHRFEKQAYAAAGELLRDRHEPPMEEMVREGERYFPVEFNAEAILSVGRAAMFIKRDGADMIVNVSPFMCMPGTITAAIFRQMSSRYGIPIVSMFYDGTVGINEKIVTFLRNLKRGREEEKEEGEARPAPARVAN